VHLSDTHNMHRQIVMPPGDILIHTGDCTQAGSDAELKDFDDWLGEQKAYFRHVIVIAGNHDWHTALQMISSNTIDPNTVLQPDYMRKKLSSCTFLDHQLAEVCGLKIFGSSWIGWHESADPGRVPRPHEEAKRMARHQLWVAYHNAHKDAKSHRYDEIPEGIDILLTHGPVPGILDNTGGGFTWGSSELLKQAVYRTRPTVHLFGHLHEQRGLWEKSEATGRFTGRVEYIFHGKPFETHDPPPSEYPCELICNTAMCNHEKLEGITTKHLAGPPRVIFADRIGGKWKFSTELSS